MRVGLATRWNTAVLLAICAVALGVQDRTAVAEDTGERPRILDEIGIPTVDVSAQRERHVTVAQGTQEIWNSHPNTLLMPDGRMMFASWTRRDDGTRRHGAPAGNLKRSDDGGLTWSDRLDTPTENPNQWREAARGNPTIHRLVDSEGVERLFVFSRTPDRGSMLQAVSEDGGETWSPMEENGLGPLWTPPQSVIPVDNGARHLMWYEDSPEDEDGFVGVIWQSASTDGGLTWGESRPVVEMAGASEPGVLRSPDGSQLLMLIRENDRRYNSLYVTSDDEGKTWSAPKELPRALTGDRHDGVYAPDGRLVIVFRDRAEEADTYRHFVAWVGAYEDIVEDREGAYRAKLLHCHGPDTGYPGIELLPDGTIVATTYVQYEPDELHSIVSVRFTVEELDAQLQAADD